MSLAESLRTIDCKGNLVVVSEPSEWRTWARKPAGSGDGSGTLFGFGFSHHAPRGWRYGGYEDTELIDSTLCPRSHVSLDNWLRAGDLWWTRSPSELALSAGPNETFVISGVRWDQPNSSPAFVTAFRRDRQPQRFPVGKRLGPWVLFVLLSVVPGTVIAHRRFKGPLPSRALGYALFAYFALWLLALALGLQQSLSEMDPW
ncbi:MAG: hypothetical protein QM756_33995 [Polyangiaceae bacterium]